MTEYNVVPEYRHGKKFPFFAIAYQFVAIGFIVFGYHVASAGFVLAYIFQFCALYYGGLFYFNKFYRLNISSSFITVWNIINKPKIYPNNKLRWRIGRIPWYNSYFVLLYSSQRIPIAIVRPHWKNALKILSFPHLGKLSSVELEYLKFLKSVGLL